MYLFKYLFIYLFICLSIKRLLTYSCGKLLNHYPPPPPPTHPSTITRPPPSFPSFTIYLRAHQVPFSPHHPLLFTLLPGHLFVVGRLIIHLFIRFIVLFSLESFLFRAIAPLHYKLCADRVACR